MAIRPNWGPGKQLAIKIFEDDNHVTMETAVNEWFASLDTETILSVQLEIEIYGTPKEEFYHVQILYAKR